MTLLLAGTFRFLELFCGILGNCFFSVGAGDLFLVCNGSLLDGDVGFGTRVRRRVRRRFRLARGRTFLRSARTRFLTLLSFVLSCACSLSAISSRLVPASQQKVPKYCSNSSTVKNKEGTMFRTCAWLDITGPSSSPYALFVNGDYRVQFD